jgi:hypothetical protein
VKLLQLAFASMIASLDLALEHPSHTLDRMPLPAGNHVRMNAVPHRQLRHRLLAPDRLQSNLRLELSRKTSSLCHRGSSFSCRDPP